jgi:hypothetical protein
MADNLSPSSAVVTESGNLNLPESSGPLRPVIGLFTYIIVNTLHKGDNKDDDKNNNNKNNTWVSFHDTI